MVEAERVDVSLKENDVKNRRSLPIPNHSFPPHDTAAARANAPRAPHGAADLARGHPRTEGRDGAARSRPIQLHNAQTPWGRGAIILWNSPLVLTAVAAEMENARVCECRPAIGSRRHGGIDPAQADRAAARSRAALRRGHARVSESRTATSATRSQRDSFQFCGAIRRPREKKLTLSEVKEMFERMREHLKE
jgi:hypothetical protein